MRFSQYFVPVISGREEHTVDEMEALSPPSPAISVAPAAGAVERDIGRLVARIAELEERLYAAELRADAPVTPVLKTPSSNSDWKAAIFSGNRGAVGDTQPLTFHDHAY
jgi:hypothetical protein